jgi:hypothetical protein
MSTVPTFQKPATPYKVYVGSKMNNPWMVADTYEAHTTERALIELIRCKATECKALKDKLRDLEARLALAEQPREQAQIEQSRQKLLRSVNLAKRQNRKLMRVVQLHSKITALEAFVDKELDMKTTKVNLNKTNLRLRGGKKKKTKRAIARKQPWK